MVRETTEELKYVMTRALLFSLPKASQQDATATFLFLFRSFIALQVVSEIAIMHQTLIIIFLVKEPSAAAIGIILLQNRKIKKLGLNVYWGAKFQLILGRSRAGLARKRRKLALIIIGRDGEFLKQESTI